MKRHTHARLPRALAILLLAALSPIAAAGDATADRCDPAQLDDIRGEVVLPAGCEYRRPIRITTSHTTLDCNGSVFIGNERQKIGLLIDSQGRALSDVTVRNCTFTQFASSAVRITWNAADSAKGRRHKDIYARTPTRITLDNITARGNRGVGIYFDDYVTDSTLSNSLIENSGAVGLYLEHSSRNNRILNNRFVHNGYRDGRKARREGIAIDSSSDNIVTGNTFEGNAAGGIFLYKNCGEHMSSGKQVLRWKHSNHNLLENNHFIDETVGIWLASRSQMDLSGWDCGDAPLDASRGLYRDYADFNTVKNNSFCRTKTAVIDNGRKNIVSDSQITCDVPSTSSSRVTR